MLLCMWEAGFRLLSFIMFDYLVLLFIEIVYLNIENIGVSKAVQAILLEVVFSYVHFW